MPCSPHGAGPVEQTANNVVNKKCLLYRVQMAKFNKFIYLGHATRRAVC